MCGFRKFFQWWSNFDVVFLVDEGREDPNTTISGPSSACQRNAIKWHFAGGQIMICLFDLILYVPSTIFQLYRDGSYWVEPVLS